MALALVVTGLIHAQTAEIRSATRSPQALAAYVKSHPNMDWIALWGALGVKHREPWVAPCAGLAHVGVPQCSVSIESVPGTGESIVVIKEDSDLTPSIEYLRYHRIPAGGWKFAGEFYSFQKKLKGYHKLIRIGTNPFLIVASDYSQTGISTGQILEDWFDLSRDDFHPVFSITAEGNNSRWNFGVGRTIHTKCTPSVTDTAERITVALDVNFDAAGKIIEESAFSGVYERGQGEPEFLLRTAYSGSDPRHPLPLQDFKDLADPFSGLSNEKLLAFAINGLRKIAIGSDPDAREWLEMVLENAGNTPEKPELLDLLKK